MTYVIRTENLSKNYGRLKAVDGVSLKVEKGEIYGFVGVN
ncbi:MAG: bacitracin ABC transporter ATP-binding protein, partial [Clostridia bacterium]|nr:bacitracin ABC transporter ATP-binding protein [Clostridia bacterium]